MKTQGLLSKMQAIALSATVVFGSLTTFGQTNVYDDVISTSPNHTSLTAAINAAGLQSALQNPAATLTVFAPTNAAFDQLASDLGTDIPGLLALPNLSDVLLYHVLGVTAEAADIDNGDIVTPLNTANTIKLTKTSSGSVYANHAMVNAADLSTDNGVVHSIDAVILSNETVVDVAIDNNFSTLVTAVVTAELVPALTDPFGEFTVFAPTNAAFDNLATALGTDLNGILALPNLADVLLYHVVGSEVLSTDLVAGPVETLNGQDVIVSLTMGVMINNAMVTLPDVQAQNGVVHVIDRVLLPTTNSIGEIESADTKVYPNPASEFVNISVSDDQIKKLSIISNDGKIISETTPLSNATSLDVNGLNSGAYIIRIEGNRGVYTKSLMIDSRK